MNKFSNYLESAFLDWQSKLGKRKTLNEFAEHLGIKRNLLSMWMNGTRRPGPGTIPILVEKLGLGIYDALDLPTPDEDLYFISKHWKEIPESLHKKMAEEIGEYLVNKPRDE